MSKLKAQLDEALVLTKAMHDNLKRLNLEAEESDSGDYSGFDEYKADAYEAAVELLDAILDAHANEEPGIVLRFGDGADADTFNNVFGHLDNGYVIEVNGQDMVCLNTGTDRLVGLYGLTFDNDEAEATDIPIGVSWDDLESVKIY